MKVAIIGAGIAGLMAAATLHQREHSITVYEANDYIGGHVKTLRIPIDQINCYPKHNSIPTPPPQRGQSAQSDSPCIVEMGVFMHDPYSIHPMMGERIKQLGIKTEGFQLTITSDNRPFDFAWTNVSRFTGTVRDLDILLRTVLHGIRSGPRRILRDTRFFFELRRFFDHIPTIRTSPLYREMSLGDYAANQGLSDLFLHSWPFPQLHCWWGVQSNQAMCSSITAIVESFEVVANAPQQYIFTDGWETFIQALCAPFQETIRTRCSVNSIVRHQVGSKNNLEVKTDDGSAHYDAIILAIPPSRAVDLIQNPFQEEIHILKRFSTTTTKVYLHTDPSWMPKHEKWSIVNLVQDQHRTFTTLWSGALDNRKPGLFISWIDTDQEYTTPDPSSVLDTREWLRTLPTVAYMSACTDIPSIQGLGGIWHCGAHVDALGAGDRKHIPSLWHENAFRSGIAVAEALDAQWKKQGVIKYE